MKEELPNEKLREAEDMEIDIKELLFNNGIDLGGDVLALQGLGS